MTTAIELPDDDDTEGKSDREGYPAPFRNEYIVRSAKDRETVRGIDHRTTNELHVYEGEKLVSVVKPASRKAEVKEIGQVEEVSQYEPDDELENDPDLADRLAWREERKKRAAASPVAQRSKTVVSAPSPIDRDRSVQPGTLPGSRIPLPSGLDFLDAADGPHRPTKAVVFTIENVGNMLMRYHEIVVTHNSIVLVYDNRYADGMQFVPASSSAPVTVQLPGENAVYRCVSLGLSWSMGCMDCVLLVKEQPE